MKVDRSQNLYDVSDQLTLSLWRDNALERVMQILRHWVAWDAETTPLH